MKLTIDAFEKCYYATFTKADTEISTGQIVNDKDELELVDIHSVVIKLRALTKHELKALISVCNLLIDIEKEEENE